MFENTKSSNCWSFDSIGLQLIYIMILYVPLSNKQYFGWNSDMAKNKQTNIVHTKKMKGAILIFTQSCNHVYNFM